MRFVILAILVSTFSFSSPAKAEGGSLDSLEGRTQLGLGGNLTYDTYGGSSWNATTSGFYYVGSRFGIGGLLSLANGTYWDVGTVYRIAPAIEYFVPLADRHHIFTQASFGLSGAQKTSSTFNLGAKLGYRYFIVENVALQGTLSQDWYQSNTSGAKLDRVSGPQVEFGFSIFF